MIAISPEYLRHVVERLASLGSHPLGFRVAGTPEEREATAFVAGGDARSRPAERDRGAGAGRRVAAEEAFVELPDGPGSSAHRSAAFPRPGARG